MNNFLRAHVDAFQHFNGVARTLLYDNLRSVVLERRGDAIRFHPTLLELAAHYRFAPRPVAPYRGNEKGRVERMIRFVRDRFFAARPFTDLDDLNAQALAWCTETAAERPCPEDRHRTVRDVFDEEQPRLLPLPDNPFETDERLQLSVRKTPYARFDKNDYSVPHDRVNRTLVVLANLKTVRILDDNLLIASHPRSFDQGQQIEDPNHIEALIEHKRAARKHRAIDRLHHAAPAAKELFLRAGQRAPITWGFLPAGCCDYSTPTAPPHSMRPSAMHSNKTRPISGPCDNSSTGAVMHVVFPHHCPCICPMTQESVTCTSNHTHSPTTKHSNMTTSTTTTMNPELSVLRERLRRLALYGLLTQDDAVLGEPWIPRLIDIEELERARRSLKRRLDNARLGSFKPLNDFDWDWPTKIDRPLIDELFTLEFLNETANAVLLGPNGIGKNPACQKPHPHRRPARLYRTLYHRLRHAPRPRRSGLRFFSCPASSPLYPARCPLHR